MFSVSRAKGKTGLQSCGCDQSIRKFNTVDESVLFDEAGGRGADGFGKRQDPELQLVKRLLDLPRLQLRPGVETGMGEHQLDEAVMGGDQNHGGPVVAQRAS